MPSTFQTALRSNLEEWPKEIIFETWWWLEETHTLKLRDDVIDRKHGHTSIIPTFMNFSSSSTSSSFAVHLSSSSSWCLIHSRSGQFREMENMEIKSPIGIVAVTIGSIIWSSEFNLAIGFVLNTNKGQIKNSLINRYDACASQSWMLFNSTCVGVGSLRLKEDKIYVICEMYLLFLKWYICHV